MSSSDILDVLMITYNRPEYTQLSLPRLLDSCSQSMRVWVWHNGTDEATLDVVRSCSNHPRFHRLEISPENRRLRAPTNWFWSQSSGQFVSKVDDDCLMPDGWGDTLMKAHRDNPTLGIIGCWRFYDEDFAPELAMPKVMTMRNGHRLMRNCWVQGSGYVMKRACIERHGVLGPKESFPRYCVRTALRGWVHGWYFPFIHEEHMDDPRSPYCRVKTDEELAAKCPLTARQNNVTSIAEWIRHEQHMARSTQAASPDPRHHAGWRHRLASLRRRLGRLMGEREQWQTA